MNNKLFKKYLYSLFILTKVYAHRQNKISFFGSFWTLLQPLAHIIIISYIFGLLLKQQRQVMLFNLVAILPFWNFLNLSLINGANSLISNDYIIKKSIVSRSLFPLAEVMIQCQNLFFAFIAMYSTFSMLYANQFHLRVLLLPLVAMPLIISVMSITIALAHLTPYIRDIPQILTVLLNALYWTIPIIYPYELIPPNKQLFFELNPVFILFRPIQLIVTIGMPSIIMLIKAVIVCVISTIISYFIYKKCRKNVIFYM